MEVLGQLLRREQIPGIGAEQREAAGFAEPVPQFLEPHGGVVQASFAQQRHHFAEGVDAASLRAGLAHRIADDLVEQALVGPAVDHEPGQGGGRVQHDEFAREPGGLALQGAEAHQLPAQRIEMLLGGDHDRRTAAAQAAVEEVGDLGQQDRVIMVETDEMGWLAGVFPY